MLFAASARKRSQRRARNGAARRSLSLQLLERRQLLAAGPVIAEFMASNHSTLTDGFGDDSDWIEIFHDSATAINLQGYHLTDNPANLSKWEFTSPAVLQPGERLVVFASSRNTVDPSGFRHTNFSLAAGGGYVALTAPDLSVLSEFGSGGADYPPQIADVSYGLPGTVLVNGQSVAEYLIPTDDSLGETWTAVPFDAQAAGFSTGRAAIGYEDSPGSGTSYASLLETTVPSGTTNVYARMSFDVPDASQASDLQLKLNFDDGVVVYLNGTRLFGVNDPTPLGYNTPATQTHADASALAGVVYNLDAHVGLLNSGQNTLAIHALNGSNSSDFLIVPELISNSIHTDVGYLLTPTPGETNGLAQPLGPMIQNVTPSVPVATAGQPLVITAEISDFDNPLDATTPRLHYRVMFGGEVAANMIDDGTGADAVADDGLFSAQIPGSALVAGQLVRWYVTASDTAAIETRSPRFLDALDSPEYFGTVVDDPAITTDLPLMQWFIANPNAASTTAGTRATLFLGGELYDNIQVDNHGQSTRGAAFPKKSFDFDANSGEKFRVRPDLDRVSDFNLLTNYADQTKLRNTLMYDLFAQADYAHHFAFSVMVYRNGSFYGLYDLVEEGDREYLQRLDLDDDNPLYKVNNRLDHAYSRVEKKSREYEDHTDFQQVVDAAQSLSGSAATTWDYDHLDIADMVNYLAIHNVAVSSDFGHKNMYWYRDTNGTGLWSAFPWDQDLSLGHQWDANVSPPYFKDDLITDLNIFRGGNNIFQRLYAEPDFRQMFTRRVRTLADQFYALAGSPAAESYLGQHILALQPLIADEAIQDSNFWGIHPNFTHTPAEAAQQLLDEFIPLRRAYLDSHAEVPASQVGSPTILFDDVDYDADPVSGLQSEEYVRLNNPNSFAVDISGWRIDGGIDHTFKGGTVLPAGGSLYVVKDVAAFQNRATGPSSGGQLFLQGNYSGQLTYTGETVRLIDPLGNVLDTLVTPVGTPTVNQQFLRVTEINYHPIAADAEFIELMNISSGGVATTLDLSGVSITEGPSDPFVFPAATMLGPGQRLLVVQDSGAFQLAYPTIDAAAIAGQYVGKLSNGGERVKVVDAGGETIFDFDYTDGDPWSIAPDGSGATLQLVDEVGTPPGRLDKHYSWRASGPSGGTPAAAKVDPIGIKINEVLAHTDAPLLDSIELHNTTSQPIDVSGWYLSDSGGTPLKFQIPAGTVIAAGGYVVFDENDFNPTPLTPGPNDFALSGSHGDSVWLVIANPAGTSVETIVDAVDFGASFNGVSLGRLPDGSGRLAPLAQRSLGAANGDHAIADVVITEVNYHPDLPSSAALQIDPTIGRSDLEFVELHNHTSAAVDLNLWRLRGDRDFDFAQEVLAGGETLLLVSFDPDDVADANRMAAFRTHYGIGQTVRLVGPMSGQLSNRFGLVKLQSPDEAPLDEPTVMPKVVVDEVLYDDLVPWPEAADGAGQSLQRSSAAAYGNDPQSWRGSLPTPGVTRFVPTTEQITVNGTDATRSAVTSVEVQFDSAVQAPESAFVLTNTDTGEMVSVNVQTSIVQGKTLATLTFNAGLSVVQRNVGGNSLADGRYELVLRASEIFADTGGAPMDDDVVFGDEETDDFFRKFGDQDGDDLVGLLDFARFRNAFGRAQGHPDYRNDLDSNGDGMITLFDFSAFRSNFGS